MLHQQYYVELEKYNKLIARKNVKSDSYNGIYDRYQYPVLTREHIPLHWRYDLNPETNPYFMERLGVNAVMNSGAIELDGKYYLVARIEGNDRKSFFGVAESDNGIDGFTFWDYPILLPDTCPEETNVYDMRLTKHEDGYIYGVFCSESKDTTVNDLSAAVAAAGIVRTRDLKNWERLPNLVTKRSPQQRNVVLCYISACLSAVKILLYCQTLRLHCQSIIAQQIYQCFTKRRFSVSCGTSIKDKTSFFLCASSK